MTDQQLKIRVVRFRNYRGIWGVGYYTKLQIRKLLPGLEIEEFGPKWFMTYEAEKIEHVQRLINLRKMIATQQQLQLRRF